jgi:hypothetical protein
VITSGPTSLWSPSIGHPLRNCNTNLRASGRSRAGVIGEGASEPAAELLDRSRGARLERAVAPGLGRHIVAAVVDLGVNLGLRWIAEGVRDDRSALTSA